MRVDGSGSDNMERWGRLYVCMHETWMLDAVCSYTIIKDLARIEEYSSLAFVVHSFTSALKVADAVVSRRVRTVVRNPDTGWGSAQS